LFDAPHLLAASTPQHITAEHRRRTPTTIRGCAAIIALDDIGRRMNRRFDLPIHGARHAGILPRRHTVERKSRPSPSRCADGMARSQLQVAGEFSELRPAEPTARATKPLAELGDAWDRDLTERRLVGPLQDVRHQLLLAGIRLLPSYALAGVGRHATHDRHQR